MKIESNDEARALLDAYFELQDIINDFFNYDGHRTDIVDYRKCFWKKIKKTNSILILNDKNNSSVNLSMDFEYIFSREGFTFVIFDDYESNEVGIFDNEKAVE